MRDIILASASPRRRELMEKIGLPFTVAPANVPEFVPEGLPAARQAEYLANLKAGFMAGEFTEQLIIGADTTVVYEDEVLGKPADRADAVRMLHLLSGRSHRVYTGVALLCEDFEESFTSVTEVEFYPLSDEEIEAYADSGEAMDKAGAYGIQGKAFRFVKEIRGDYNTVVGLPAAELLRRLEARGYKA